MAIIDCTISHNQEDGVKFVWICMRGELTFDISGGTICPSLLSATMDFRRESAVPGLPI